MGWYNWRPYVPVAERRRKAVKNAEKFRKKGLDIKPVEIEGRKIARTFWGEAWCDHLESFSDYENRLPRGRAYVRNGLVCHLDIARGEIKAMVSGSSLYTVNITIKTLPGKKWKEVKEKCAGQIGSLLELLQGRLSRNVMSVVTDRDKGLFPLPGEISLHCSCPDWAVMCKHVAAVLYGAGARLDKAPDLLFLLRGVDHEELISAEVGLAVSSGATGSGRRRIAEESLADVFGIEMSEKRPSGLGRPSPTRKKAAPQAKKTLPAPKAANKTRTRRPVKPDDKKSRPPKKPTLAEKAPRTATRGRPVTGQTVARLRTKFGLSPSEFARLLGVSPLTVGNWEKKTGAIDFQPRSREAWNAVKNLTKTQARQKLDLS